MDRELMFAPKGELPKWRPLYDAFKAAKVDTVFTYDELTAIGGFDVVDDRSPIYQAMKNLERNDQRTIKNERGVGYRVARADEHYDEAIKHRRKGKRQLTRAERKAASADRSKLSSAASQRLDALQAQLGKQAAMLVNHENRIRAVERASTKNSVQLSKHDRELAELANRLKALGLEPKLTAVRTPPAA